MLVVSREEGQSVTIGTEIEVVIVRVRGRRICLGISAPRAIPVHRTEVHEAIELQALGANMPSPPHPRRFSRARAEGPDLAGVPARRSA